MLYYLLWIALRNVDDLKAVHVCRKSLPTNATANKSSESYQQYEQQQQRQWEYSPRYGINFLIKQRAQSEKNNNIRAKHRKITKKKIIKIGDDVATSRQK